VNREQAWWYRVNIINSVAEYTSIYYQAKNFFFSISQIKLNTDANMCSFQLQITRSVKEIGEMWQNQIWWRSDLSLTPIIDDYTLFSLFCRGDCRWGNNCCFLDHICLYDTHSYLWLMMVLNLFIWVTNWLITGEKCKHSCWSWVKLKHILIQQLYNKKIWCSWCSVNC
jgi:hypothetical protein